MYKVLVSLLLGVALTVPTFGQAAVDAAQLKKLVADKAVVLDVRTQQEWNAGHLPMAHLFPLEQITALSAARLIPTKATTVVVYCRSGNRSAQAAQILVRLGYTNVRDFGAITRWPDALSTQP
jgi:rhodanese-related sulfurtransferase